MMMMMMIIIIIIIIIIISSYIQYRTFYASFLLCLFILFYNNY